MKRLHPTLLTALLAHVAGSYCACIISVIELIQNPPDYSVHGQWIYPFLAPIFTPLYLIIMTLADFPRYPAYLPQTWAAYTIPFVIVCLLRRRNSNLIKFAMLPVASTLFVTALWISGRLLGWLPPALAATGSWQSDLLGNAAPDFDITTVAGTSTTLSQEKGHVVLIDFWATTCPPCRVELKQTIAALAADPKLRDRGLRIWTIDEDDDAAARKFMDDNHYNFDVKLDTQSLIWTRYHGYGIPDTFLIGRDGVIRYASAGFGPAIDAQLHAAIEAALK